jgi:hypothetical protein
MLSSIKTVIVVGILMPIAGIFLSHATVQEDTIVINQPIFAQPATPYNSILLNKTNMTAQITPTITENITTMPAPEVNETLIGRSTPTTSNSSLQIDNKTGGTEPLGGIK